MAFSLRARYVFPVHRPPIERGIVTVAGQHIADIGTVTTGIEVMELGDVALLPGFVNAHTHLEFSHLRRPLGTPGMSLVDWIRLIIAERARRNGGVEMLLAAGIEECLRAGVTSIGDITSGDELPQTGQVDLTLFHEVIGFSRVRADSAFAALIERLRETEAALQQSRTDKILMSTEIGISPHAPYTVSPQLLNKLLVKARERQAPVAMHLAESREELQLLCNGTGPFQELLDERSMWDPAAIPRGSCPLDYLKMLAEAPRALVIHGNYLDNEELEYLATKRARMSLIYCPRTHAYFQHPPYPLANALGTGVRIALGTDSRASNPDLSLLAEMQFIVQQHPMINPADILCLGTLAGAEALGRQCAVGSLTPGKLANMVAVPIPGDVSTPTAALEAIFASENSLPCAVWLRGEPSQAD